MIKTKKLGEVFDIRKGKKAAATSDSFVPGSHPYIQIDEVRGVTPTKFAIDPKPVVVTGNDLCIVWDGANAGTVGYGVSGAIGSTVSRMRLKEPERWDPRFLGRLLDGLFPKLNAEAQSRGATIPHVDKAKLEEIDFPLIDPTEQRRIAAILDKADAIRRKREQALTLADDFLRSVFLEMFGDPGENPMNWDREPLSLQAEVKIGFPFKSAEYVEEGIRLCRGANTMPDRLEWSDTRYWPVSDAARFAEYALVSGDIILALDRPWISSGLKVAEVIQADLPALLVQRVARIRSSVPAEKPFVFQCLRHPSFWSYCNPTETTIPHISPVELKNYPMIKPPRELVAAFGVIAAKQSVLRQKVEQDAKDARQLFQSLSQRAFAADL